MSGKKIIDDKLWEAIKSRWVELKYDPILLSPVEYWAEIRKQTPFEVFVSVAHRALIGGIDV